MTDDLFALDLGRLNHLGWLLLLLTVGIMVAGVLVVLSAAGAVVGEGEEVRLPAKPLGFVICGGAAAFFFGGRWVLSAVGLSIYRRQAATGGRNVGVWVVVWGLCGLILLATVGLIIFNVANGPATSTSPVSATSASGSPAPPPPPPPAMGVAGPVVPPPPPPPPPAVPASFAANGPPEPADGAGARANREFRTWRDATGQFEIEARLLSEDGVKVLLQKRDEEEIQVPLSRLSRADRDYVAKERSAGPSLSAESPSGPGLRPSAAPGPSRPSRDPVDLLSLVDLQRDPLQGQWQREGRHLVSPPTEGAMLQLPYALPQEYCLTIVAQPITGSGGFNVGIVVDGRQTMIALEGWGINANGLSLVDGQTADNNPTTKIASVFAPGIPTTIVCTVRKSTVEVTSNGQPLVRWSGPAARLSLDTRFWPNSAPDKAFLGTWQANYRISKIELAPLAH